ncbi:hypothetical protein [Bythopirellula goksoeyrii]|uniref:Uncharacterized protein n=1 Tax=Bythopirellula goksoeyrii TaxID=1400387 RepID=A0A5B9Q634_9BACT|nr:hypothetical protein [Bythopirellula goksoeyrii]QEG34498.1 hypothetical protein Pr1d_17780 [Bythopirellula goksoeyrii]
MTNSNSFTSSVLLSLGMILTLSPLGDAATLKKSSEAGDPTAAYVTDQPGASSPAAEEVAREVLRLQEELGGSIVSDFSAPEPPKSRPWAPPPTAPPVPTYHLHQPSWTARQSTPVDALRETAWRMEQSAYLLESLDLYSQADALRTTATRLRQDARKIKSGKNPSESTANESVKTAR